MRVKRSMWTSAATALAVGIATGTVHAAPLTQIDIPVEQLYAVGGVLLVALAVALSIIAAVIMVVRFAQSRTPTPEPGIQNKLVDLLSDTTDAIKHVGDSIASMTQEHKQTREQADEAQRLSEAAWQRIRDYDAGHQRAMNDINSTQLVITEALGGVNEKIQTTAVQHEQSVQERHRATNDNIDATRLSLSMKVEEMAAQLTIVQTTVEKIEASVGMDTRAEVEKIGGIVSAIQAEMIQLHEEINRVAQAYEPKGNADETLNPNPSILPTADAPGAGANDDASGDAGDNPQ
jgi:hypothetical protein